MAFVAETGMGVTISITHTVPIDEWHGPGDGLPQR